MKHDLPMAKKNFSVFYWICLLYISGQIHVDQRNFRSTRSSWFKIRSRKFERQVGNSQTTYIQTCGGVSQIPRRNSNSAARGSVLFKSGAFPRRFKWACAVREISRCALLPLTSLGRQWFRRERNLRRAGFWIGVRKRRKKIQTRRGNDGYT